MNDIVKAPPVIQTDTATILAILGNAASNPETDIAKVEKFVDLYTAMQARNAEAEFYAALSEMQDELPSIEERGGIKDRSGNIQSTYALWEDVNKAIKPVLKKFGFALSFRTNFENGISVTGVLSHKSGHKEMTSIVLPSDNSGSKNAVQAIGSSVSYGKRYTAGSLLNLVSHGEDDDGAGNGPQKLSEEQAAAIQTFATSLDVKEAQFFKVLNKRFGGNGVKSYADIPAGEYDYVMGLLKQKQAQQGGKDVPQ